jgi:hypothetical protein
MSCLKFEDEFPPYKERSLETNISHPRQRSLLFPQDSTCFHCERSLSSFDVRHRWVLGAVYDLPVGRAKC